MSVNVETDARGVATVTLNRPDKHNALDAATMTAVTEAAQTLGQDEAVRVVVLRGAGKSFCAGGDLGWMKAQMEADGATRVAEATKLAMMLKMLNEMPKPLIGRVQGNAFGGGVGLMSVCDVAIGADRVKLGLTETKLGLIPATIGPYVVARMGEGMARRVFMSSRLFGAEEAVTLGLLAKVVPEAELDDAVEAEVAPYLECKPGAVAAAKRLARRLGPDLGDAVIAETIEALRVQWESDEARDGVAAFFERR